MQLLIIISHGTKKDRREVIRKSIRSGLKNTTPRDDNKAFYHDTSSNNILTISVKLKKD